MPASWNIFLQRFFSFRSKADGLVGARSQADLRYWSGAASGLSRSSYFVVDVFDSLRFLCGDAKIARSMAAFPIEFARRMTIALRPDLLLAQLGASPGQQIALLPDDISDLIEQILLVDTEAIRWGGRPPRKYRSKGLAIVDGDWDTCCREPIDNYLRSDVFGLCIHELFVERRRYTETTQYSQMVERLKRGDTPKHCTSMADIHIYFDRLYHLYRMIKADGYKSQIELGTGVPQDEIMVYVDRHGELHKQQGSGHHRLAIARLLKVKCVPVCILGVHNYWVEHCHHRFGGDVISALRRGMSEELSVKAISTP